MKENAPPLEAFLAIIAMFVVWPVILKLLISYTFKDDGIRVYLLGLRIVFIRTKKIEWIQVVRWTDLLCGTMTDTPRRWSTIFVANSFFRKLLIVKTVNKFYWVLTPKAPEDILKRMQPTQE